jgi:hypothetical protein
VVADFSLDALVRSLDELYRRELRRGHGDLRI